MSCDCRGERGEGKKHVIAKKEVRAALKEGIVILRKVGKKGKALVVPVKTGNNSAHVALAHVHQSSRCNHLERDTSK